MVRKFIRINAGVIVRKTVRNTELFSDIIVPDLIRIPGTNPEAGGPLPLQMRE